MKDPLFSWWNNSFDQLEFNTKENLAFLNPITDALLATGRLDETIPPLCIETDQRWAKRSVVRYGSDHYSRMMIEEKDRDETLRRKRVHSRDSAGGDGEANDGSRRETTVTPSPKRRAIGASDTTNKGSDPKPKGLGMTGWRGLPLNKNK